MTSLPGFDGWADDVTESGQHKDYVYSNDNGGERASTVNLYSVALVYIFSLPSVEAELELQSGPRLLAPQTTSKNLKSEKKTH